MRGFLRPLPRIRTYNSKLLPEDKNSESIECLRKVLDYLKRKQTSPNSECPGGRDSKLHKFYLALRQCIEAVLNNVPYAAPVKSARNT